MKYLRTAAGLLLAVLLLGNAALADYRFDDLYGPSGVSAQWMVINNSGQTFGGKHTTAMNISTDLTSTTSPTIEVHSGQSFSEEIKDHSINTLFMVMSQQAGPGTYAINIHAPDKPDDPITPSVGLGTTTYEYGSGSPYSSQYTSTYKADNSNIPASTWKGYLMNVYKSSGADSTYDTVRQVINVHNNPREASSQTIYRPLIIANVSSQTANEAPLELRMTLRENNSSGNIAAFTRETWRVNSNLYTGASNWVFVPVDDLDTITREYYYLTTEVANHTSVRYASGNATTGDWDFPAEWRFDLPKYQGITDIPSRISLAEMSHIAPGLVSVFRRRFDITEENKRPLRLFAVDDNKRNGEWDLILNHDILYGQRLGAKYEYHASGSYNDYEITPYKPRSYNMDFNKVLAYEMSSDFTAVTVPSNVSLTSSITHNASGMPADAVRYFTLNHTIPGNVRRSYNTEGVLPLYITMNIPVTQIRNREWYNDMLTEWRNTGSIERTFKANFEICLLAKTFGANNPWNLSDFLDRRGVYEDQIHVFLDEDRGRNTGDNAPGLITVSFIVYMMDGNRDGVRPEIKLVKDKLSTSEHDYIVIRDGTYDNKWQMTFFVMPTGAITNNEANDIPNRNNNNNASETSSSSGGGGCNAGISLIALMLLAGFFLKKRSVMIMLLVMVMSFPAYGFTVSSNVTVIDESEDITLLDLNGTYSDFAGILASIDANIDSLDADPELTITGTVTLTDTVKFSDYGNIKTLTITGGTFTNAENRIFAVDSDINNLSFSGTTFTGSGLEISSGTVNFASCIFSGNTGTNGGALEITGGTVSLSGTNTFGKNTATSSGGAVYTTQTLTLSDTLSFTDNSADIGGAIYTTQSQTFPEGTSFTTNTASSSGGAIYSSGALTFSGTGTFTGNIAGTSGGAIYAASGATFSDESIFTANEAGTSGGAIYSTGTLTLATTTFTGNHAQDGGAIYTTGTLTGSGTVTFTSNYSDLYDSTALDPEDISGTGGAIYTSGTTSFANAVFTGNYAPSGGAVYSATGASLSFTGTATFGTEASPNKGYDGGALYIAGGTTSFSGTASFSYNEALNNGGAITVKASSANLTFSTVPEFTSNTANSDSGASGDGGAIWWGVYTPLFPSSGKFTDNKALLDSQALSADAGNGGAIYFAGSGTFTINADKDYIFTQNLAYNNGGAIYTSTASVVFDGVSISGDNTALYGNGGFLRAGGSVTVTNYTDITGSMAGSAGGAIYTTSTLTLTNSSFYDLQAKDGGAVYASGAITITSCDFQGNTAVYQGTFDGVTDRTHLGGGAVYGEGNIDITSSYFAGNTSNTTNSGAEYHGGGAVLCEGILTVTDTEFSGNVHTHNDPSRQDNGGGAIRGFGRIILTQSLFTGNHSTNMGGAVRSDAQTITVNDTVFSADYASHHGGAMYIVNADVVTVDDTTFTDNYTLDNLGGAIYAEALDMEIRTSYFTGNNTRQGNGGAVAYSQSGGLGNDTSLFLLEGSVFDNNTATNGNGGAVYVNADNVQIARCTFSNNQAVYQNNTVSGGAVYARIVRGTNSYINTCTFTGNSALGGTTQGGALYTQGNITVKSSTFTLSNKASGTDSKGGAIYAYSGALTMTANIVVGNTASYGADVYSEATITTNGYNRIGLFGKSNQNINWKDALTNTNDDYAFDEDTPSSTYFGSNTLAVNEVSTTQPPYAGSLYYDTRERLMTVALAYNSALPEEAQAIDAIPYEYRTLFDDTDQRGLTRPRPTNGPLDSGAVEIEQTGTVNPPSPSAYAIADVYISGIPNTLKSPGQTVSLIAMIRYTNGKTAYGGDGEDQEPVTWSSSNSNRLKVGERTGIIVAGVNQSGTATITVTVDRAREDGTKATDSAIVNVDTDMSTGMNIDADFQNYYQNYIDDLFEYDMNVAFADNSSLNNSEFQASFASLWNTQALKVQNVNSSLVFKTIYDATHSGVNIDFPGLMTGSILPLTYTWFIDTPFTGTPQAMAEKIFATSHIDFNGTTLIGNNGVDLQQALDSNALALSAAHGGKKTQIALTACIANVSASSSAQILSGMLIVPDGDSDNSLSGSMILVHDGSAIAPHDDSSSSSGGGGGGCNALSLGLLCAVILFRRK